MNSLMEKSVDFFSYADGLVSMGGAPFLWFGIQLLLIVFALIFRRYIRGVLLVVSTLPTIAVLVILLSATHDYLLKSLPDYSAEHSILADVVAGYMPSLAFLAYALFATRNYRTTGKMLEAAMLLAVSAWQLMW